MPSLTDGQRLAALLALAVVLIGSGIGLKDPWPSDEPRFALVAWEMVESGEWFFPRRGGELYPDKPPMYMWSQAAVLKLTDSLRLSHTLPSLLYGLITLLLVFDLGRRIWDGKTATAAALLLLASPQFVLEARAGQVDAMVTAWIALGVYGFLRHILLGPAPGWLLVGFAACGFGTITKGVGFLPLLMLLLLLPLRRQSLPGRVGGYGLAGFGVMLLAACCWLLPMLWLVNGAADPAYDAYRDNILMQQTAERYARPSHHFKPPWYFLTNVIPALWLPVFLLLPGLVPYWWKQLRRPEPVTVLILGWAALVLLFFSLSPAKRGVYILPALPWVCLAAAPVLPALLQKGWAKTGAWLVPLALGLLLVAAASWLSFGDPERAAELADRYGINLPATLALAGGSVVVAVGLLWRFAGGPFLGMMGALWLTMGLWVYPRLDGVKSGRDLLLRVEQALGPNTPLALVDWKEQTILQSRRPTTNFGFLVPVEDQAKAAVNWLAANPNGKVLLQKKDLFYCFEKGLSVDLGIAHRREWRLVGPENVSCSLSEVATATAIKQHQITAVQDG
ncbi:MAG: glycosyltransferase family 39 protein [Pseudomonadota bacterium]